MSVGRNTSVSRRAPINRSDRRRGFSLIELLIVIAIILIIAMIALPKMNQTLMNAREMAAIAQIRTLHQAQTQYYSQFGKYATSLAELGPPKSGAAGPAAADLIPQNLAEGKNLGGYTYTLAPGANGGFTVLAVPDQFGSSGRRSFYSDQSLLVRQSWTEEPATATSAEAR